LKYKLPDPVNPFQFRTYGVDHVRQLGSTRFAREDAYTWQDQITEEHRKAYSEEGYLVIKGLVPRETIVALREELASTLGFLSYPYNENAWFMSDALLDFFVFGPFGKVAAKLLGSEDVHFIYSNQNLRHGNWAAYQDHRMYHWDSIQCCNEYFAPANKPLITNVNFQIALADDMPAMHFVNQSVTIEMLRLFGQQVNAPTLADDYLAGVLPRNVGQTMLGHLGQEPFKDRAIRPRLNAGDVIVHSPATLHRSPDGYGGKPSGWLLPSYARSDAQFMPVPYSVDRLCDTGEDLEKHNYNDFFGKINMATVRQLKDSPRPSCFPKAHPPAAARRQVGELRLSFRRKTYAGLHTGIMKWFWVSHSMIMGKAYKGPDWVSLLPPSFTDVPAAHVLG